MNNLHNNITASCHMAPVCYLPIYYDILLIPVVAFLFVALESRITYQYGDMLCALYVALIGDSAAGAIEYLLRFVRKSKDDDRRRCDQKIIAVLGLVGCIALAASDVVQNGRISGLR